MVTIPACLKDKCYAYRMPAVRVSSDGCKNHAKTRVLNLQNVASALRVNPLYLLKHWEFDFGVLTEFNLAIDEFTLNGEFSASILQESLDKFLSKYVLCVRCRYPDTFFQVKRQELRVKCNACGEIRVLDVRDRLTQVIIATERKG